MPPPHTDRLPLKLIPCPSPEAAAESCAELIAGLLERQRNPVLLVPAGKTPILLYRALVARHRNGELDLSKAHLFQLDELIGVAPEDSRSFAHFLRKELLEPAALPEECFYFLDGGAADPAGEIARHAAALNALGRGHLALLGIGGNGHVAFNEPGSRRDDGARLVSLAEDTRHGLRQTFVPTELPEFGITLGIAELYACDEVVLVATGASKAPVLAKLLSGRAGASLPAALFGDHRAFRIFADEEARSLLPGGTA